MSTPEPVGAAWTSWRKSSYSNGAGGNCVEVAWRKSSYSNGANGNCVEVAFVAEAVVAVRDSKNTTGPTLTFDPTRWREFLANA